MQEKPCIQTRGRAGPTDTRWLWRAAAASAAVNHVGQRCDEPFRIDALGRSLKKVPHQDQAAMLALPTESFEARRVEQWASKQSDCSLTGGSTRNRIARLHAQRWAICGQRGRGYGAVAFLGLVLAKIQHVLRGTVPCAVASCGSAGTPRGSRHHVRDERATRSGTKDARR